MIEFYIRSTHCVLMPNIKLELMPGFVTYDQINRFNNISAGLFEYLNEFR